MDWRGRASTLLLSLCLVLQACEACNDHPRPPHPVRTHASRTTQTSPERDLVTGKAWPDKVMSLLESVNAYSTLERCRAEVLRKLPAELAEVLSDLGYDTVVDDACLALRALKEGSPSACDALSTSSVRDGCRRRLALLAGKPDLCPRVRGTGDRDPLCIAWAQHEPSFCGAVELRNVQRCLAVATGNAKLCDKAPAESREVCRVEVSRYGPAIARLPKGRPIDDVAPIFELTATIKSQNGGASTKRVLRDESVKRGVVLARKGCEYVVRVPEGSELETWPGGGDTDRISLVFHLPPSSRPPFSLAAGPSEAEIEVSLGSLGRASSVGKRSGGFKVERLALRRGAALEITASLSLGIFGGGDVHLEGPVRTFVRDIEPMPSYCLKH